MIRTPSYFRPASPVFATQTFNQRPPNPTQRCEWFPCLAAFSLCLSFKHRQQVERHDSKLVCRSVRVEQQGEEKCLVAAHDASIGAVLLEEDAVFTTSAETQTAELAEELAALPADLQDQLLMLCRHNRAASEMREAMEKAASSGCDKTLALLEVFSVNSIGTPKGGSGLYLRCSRCNHSCKPNAYFRLSKDGQHLTLIARRPIMSGVEITISYLPESDLLRPQKHRQEILNNWGFTCQCGRCRHDDLRSFICPSCHCLVQPAHQWACNCRRYSQEELLEVEEKWQAQLVKARRSRKMVKSCWQDINDSQLLGVHLIWCFSWVTLEMVLLYVLFHDRLSLYFSFFWLQKSKQLSQNFGTGVSCSTFDFVMKREPETFPYQNREAFGLWSISSFQKTKSKHLFSHTAIKKNYALSNPQISLFPLVKTFAWSKWSGPISLAAVANKI